MYLILAFDHFLSGWVLTTARGNICISINAGADDFGNSEVGRVIMPDKDKGGVIHLETCTGMFPRRTLGHSKYLCLLA